MNHLPPRCKIFFVGMITESFVWFITQMVDFGGNVGVVGVIGAGNERRLERKMNTQISNNDGAQIGPSLPPRIGSTLAAYIARQEEWSARTFGHGVRTKGITAHIRKELLEIESDPHDVEEWIDVVILALDGAWRAGYSPEQIVSALEAKQAKNFLRTYTMPESDDEPSEHIRDVSNDKLSEPGSKI